METWTIQKLLNWVAGYFTEKGIDSPRLSGELLLSHVLGLKRIELYTQFDKIVEQDKLVELHELVKRAGEHEPIAYLTGKCEFYSLEFEVTCDCLIPRPETEVLVEQAIEFLRQRGGRQFVCDLCTGCGCIAAAIAKNFEKVRIVATDISEAALKVAAKNVTKHGLGGRVELLCGDMFEPLVPYLDSEKFDLIVCNPPYVSEAEYEGLERNVKDYEPKPALDGGEDGLEILRQIIGQAPRFLKDDGTLMLEIGFEQGPAVRGLLERSGCFGQVGIEKDLQGKQRVAIARSSDNRSQQS